MASGQVPRRALIAVRRGVSLDAKCDGCSDLITPDLKRLGTIVESLYRVAVGWARGWLFKRWPRAMESVTGGSLIGGAVSLALKGRSRAGSAV